ncbi:MAG: response regulator [Hadesarchaea archaeon]|nr:response regulator [Hadesarchaea archaeon]MDH5685346.1 response regulator [Hadesarchaea archaeon]
MPNKIMIVDDEPNICEAVKITLEAEGFKVLTALSGQECLDKLKNESVDLILMDFFMPEMNGRELCARIRKDPRLVSLPVVFLTVAQFGGIGKEKLRKLNIADYIAKPFDNEDLVKTVKKICR